MSDLTEQEHLRLLYARQCLAQRLCRSPCRVRHWPTFAPTHNRRSECAGATARRDRRAGLGRGFSGQSRTGASL